MKIVISGGGTGGHIYPALALINEVKRREPNSKVLYIGTQAGLESNLVPKSHIPFKSVSITGFKRTVSVDNFMTIFRFLKATHQARRYIKEFKPDVVVGTGGYVCGPVVYAASSMHIPTLIHEQNVIPGLTNKFLSRYTDRIAVSFAGSSEYFPSEKTVLTGNPRATEVSLSDGRRGRASLKLPGGKKYILIVGGSQGARPINDAVLEMIPMMKDYPGYYFIYVTGDSHYATVMELIKGKTPSNLLVRPFIYNMPEVLAGIDLIVNRAGASFLAEITALGLPSILIPSPYVTNNHQEKNARWLESEGAASVILETELNGRKLMNEISSILSDRAREQAMRRASSSLGLPDAATKVYKELNAITKL
ncbi:undecaprenyldiphospho-muramoylpentapeptide beta-N-acetylglucosaminyltransferase [Aneurinibacillus sp. Ricciae_BoGa-3]|uniref:undecaprenyldiphospho-muramoylpentapeptide beta-N-acetylglucosaminyltransferase n=1 Tax=Aneurinibacillus sp. Ricciae_BoGa-3 TaxID=3022697 RepID=UPI0023401630|nr:undecaprenyldiphospho-muramoylpentapeptide beta-N-acetylglucosaminyltransferase [Aneurinibacillus sp. Ricciae_BoGa-3]WCK53084.1 undecaprenyldiphospho-muramoylpentapeptide beta-N-acetylglucosaminyltransferase [Aneurinibacillus sp. Ricciae_BoGa-3]